MHVAELVFSVGAAVFSATATALNRMGKHELSHWAGDAGLVCCAAWVLLRTL